MKQKVIASFEFYITCNSDPICNSSNEEKVKQYDLALLHSFLTSDKEKLLHMLMNAIVTQLGLNAPEAFVATFLGQIDTNSHVLFGAAIDALRGDAGEYWREAREESDLPWGNVLSLATENLFACFNAEFVSSNFEAPADQDIAEYYQINAW